MSQREALDRTLLLMRDEVHDETPDEVLQAALTGTRIALVADERNIASHSAQTAFTTTAMLMARSGHKVLLLAPDVTLVGRQLPLRPGNMVEQLASMGEDMLPGVRFATALDEGEVDLAVGLGNSPLVLPAKRRIWINAEPWTGSVMREDGKRPWRHGSWPLGALAAAGLASGEGFKVTMQKLRSFARSMGRLDSVFAYSDEITFALAPSDTPFVRDFRDFDCVSGGAIINAALYVLSRISGVSGRGRVIEPDTAAMSNLNRYMLLRRPQITHAKARDIARLFDGELSFEAIPKRFEPALLDAIAPLASSLLVGVDHIPTRWAAQEAMPRWLGIGATTHWSAMASFHSAGLGCARCLHAEDDSNDGDIPTVAFVSFWGGLLLATYFLRHLANGPVPIREQQIYLTALRPENPSRLPVPRRRDCPTCASIGQGWSAA